MTGTRPVPGSVNMEMISGPPQKLAKSPVQRMRAPGVAPPEKSGTGIKEQLVIGREVDAISLPQTGQKDQWRCKRDA